MRPYQATKTSKRLRLDLKPRRVIFAQLAGEGAGRHLRLLEGLPGPSVIYLTGRPPESWKAWQHGALEGEWQVAPSYFEGATPILRYSHPRPAFGEKIGPVEIHHASEWFGGGDYSDAEAKDAWCVLETALAESMPRSRATLLATPATTGRDLARRLFAHTEDFPVLDDETQALLRSTLGQARIEGPQDLLPADLDLPALPGLYEYDGRTMYAALCWSMPVGVPFYETGQPIDHYDDYAHARYHVRARVPADWPKLFGILGVKEGAEGWRFPRLRGEEFSTWCDGSEFRIARREGFVLEVIESITWPRSSSGALRTWAREMVKLREHCVTVALEGRYSTRVLTLARHAVRQMIVTAIGAFQGRAHKVTHEASIDDPPASMPFEKARIEGDIYQWAEDEDAGWPEMSHPEWCATIWGRARARLLEAPAGGTPAGVERAGILHAQPGTQVIALRTDAIYVDRWQPWPDDGAAGRFRLVRYTHDDVPAPRSAADLLRIRTMRMHTAEGR